MLIDFTKKYRIEAVPAKDKDSEELAKKGFGVYPGAERGFCATYDNGRYTDTGLDDNAESVNILSEPERSTVKSKILKRRKYLESIIGKPGYLSPTSEAWEKESYCKPSIKITEDFRILIGGKGNNVLEPSKFWQDEVMLGVILNDSSFPKTKADLAKPQFANATFYLTSEDEIINVASENRKLTNKANYELDRLLDSEDKTELLDIAYYLGYTDGFSKFSDALEGKLVRLFANDLEGREKLRFVKALEADKGYLKAFNTVKRAIDLGIVTRDKATEVYSRGAVQYKTTIEECADLLTSPGHELEFAELFGSVTNKRKSLGKTK